VVLAENCDRHRYFVAAEGLSARIRRRSALIANFIIETLYSILLCRSCGSATRIFLCGLLFGPRDRWIGPTRDDHVVPFALALRNLWPHTLLGWGSSPSSA